MVPISAEEGRWVRLWVRRIFAIYWAPSVLQEAIHLRQVGHGSAIRPGEEGDRQGVGFILQPPVHGPLVRGLGLLQPGAPLVDAVFVLRPERGPDLSRQRRAEAAERRQRGKPVVRAVELQARIFRA